MSALLRRALIGALVGLGAVVAHVALTIAFGEGVPAQLPWLALVVAVVISFARPSDLDERTRLIALRATEHGASTAVAFPLVPGLVIWWGRYHRGCETVEIGILPLFGAAACVLFLIGRLFIIYQLEHSDLDVAES